MIDDAISALRAQRMTTWTAVTRVKSFSDLVQHVEQAARDHEAGDLQNRAAQVMPWSEQLARLTRRWIGEDA